MSKFTTTRTMITDSPKKFAIDEDNEVSVTHTKSDIAINITINRNGWQEVELSEREARFVLSAMQEFLSEETPKDGPISGAICQSDTKADNRSTVNYPLQFWKTWKDTQRPRNQRDLEVFSDTVPFFIVDMAEDDSLTDGDYIRALLPHTSVRVAVANAAEPIWQKHVVRVCRIASKLDELQWQPIESAPKTRVILLANPREMTVGYWADAPWSDATWRNAAGFVFEPTHWMHLLVLPSAVEEKA